MKICTQSSRQVLFTAGNAGFAVYDFLFKLRLDAIEIVIDVRGNAFSRTPSFSRRALQFFLEENGIQYVHA